MDSGVKTIRLKIGGMHCVHCRDAIEDGLAGAAGVQSVRADYADGTADIVYDEAVVSLEEIAGHIEKAGYSVLPGEGRPSDLRRVILVLAIIVALYALLQHFGVLNLLVPGQLADAGMGYGMLFLIGLLTSVHCIAMCGGINLSQCIPRAGGAAVQAGRFAALVPSFLYNTGRVLSYTAIGCILGLAGFLAGGGADSGLSGTAQGVLKLIAGVFMVIMGINMLGLFPALRKLQPKIFAKKSGTAKAGNRGAFLVGLLNGLMPCGPLQSMQIVALASGSPVTGALSMFLFALGTAPLMFGLGAFVSALGKRFTRSVMSIGSVLVVVLGLAMLSQGGALSGYLPPDTLFAGILILCAAGIAASIPFKKFAHKAASVFAALAAALLLIALWNMRSAPGDALAGEADGVMIVDGKQIVQSTLSPRAYPDITVRAGIPVRWVITAPEGSINGCNNRMNIQEFGITNFAFSPGESVIEFTPDTARRIRYSCWMGMIHGSITVTRGRD